MALSSGTRLGVYEVTAQIGEGGMGQVYRATDRKLKRQVAIRILPPALAADRDRLARFQREAEVLASLNHPHIAGIYGLEENEGFSALVMEFVDGEDLSERIARGPISLDDALPMAKQIAEALEAAHEQGIVHRDLKPANIKVLSDGSVKVLDFGLAKAIDHASSLKSRALSETTQSPTITTPAMTEAGMILGSAAYMSPEQAKGKPVDKRADIWAFGAVLYEMLTGQRAFKGDGVSETMAAVLKDTPDFTALPAPTPPRVRTLVERCLDRDVKLRLRDIGEARILLASPLEPAESSAPSLPSAPNRWPWMVAAASVAAAATLVVGANAGWWRIARENPTPVVQLDADFGGDLTVLTTVSISPDGQRVAFAGADEKGTTYLATRRLNETAVTRLRPIVERGADDERLSIVTPPFFSPDSEWIGYVSDGQLMKVAVTGGPATRIAGGIVTNFEQGRWGADEILVPQFAGILRVSIKDGTSSATPFRTAAFLPDGRTTLVSGMARGMAVLTPGDATPRPITQLQGRYARYVPIGYLVYVDENEVLQAVAFDLSRLTTSGDPLPLMEHVSWFDVSDTGTLVFSRTEADPGRTIGWFDETGKTETIVKEPGMYVSPRLSPDGTRLAFSIVDRTTSAILVRDLGTGITRPLASADARLSMPLWMPDGRNILSRGPGGIWTMRADGSGAPRRLIEIAGGPDSISPDGRSLAVNISGSSTKRDIVRVPLNGGSDALQASSPEPLVAGPADEINPEYSPDGKWLAYSSDQSGEYQIYVLSVRDPQSRWQVSSMTKQGVAYLPRWAPQSQRLFFKGTAGQGLFANTALSVAAYVVDDTAFVPGGVKPYGGSVPLLPAGVDPIYDVAPGGRRVVGLLSEKRAAQASSRRTFGVMLNLFAEIRRLALAGAKN